jgi:2,3-bisphosphoglycerate-independent phosphoglycerate mutase
MYKGVARLVGMEVLPAGETIKSEIETLKKQFKNFDYFYVHFKKTDSYGEDGNAQAKIKIVEEIDKIIPSVRALNPDVLVVTGDHSTPSILKGHSWHPNPVLLWSRYCRPNLVKSFGEKACLQGSLGRIPAKDLMGMMLANALRLNKFGA